MVAFGQLCTALPPLGVGLLRLAATGHPVPGLVAREVPCAQVPDRVGRLPVATAALVDLAHRNGLRVHGRTVDEVPDIEQLLDIGVTDRLDTLREVLLERGRWPV